MGRPKKGPRSLGRGLKSPEQSEVVAQRYLHAPWPAQHPVVLAEGGGVLEVQIQEGGVEVTACWSD